MAFAKRMVPMQAVQQAVQVHTSGPGSGGYAKQSPETNTASCGSSRGVTAHVMDSSPSDSSPSNSSSSSLEAALEAWMDFQPDGYSMPEDRLPTILEQIAQRLSEARSSSSDASADAVRDLFSISADDEGDPETQKPTRFQRMLTGHNGVIHFFHFWSAFSEAQRCCSGSNAGQPLRDAEILSLEFEVLRDGILVTIANMPDFSETNVSDLRIGTDKLSEVLQVVAQRSCSPRFWKEINRAFAGASEVGMLSLDDLAVVVMCWQREAIEWQHERRARASNTTAVSSKSESGEILACKKQEQGVSRGEIVPKEKETFRGGLPVFVHIYDVSQEDSVKKINKYLASRYSPIKFGGIFHAGVEVNGLEWSYGVSYTDTVPGLSCIEPRTHPAHSYRQTVQLRQTKMNAVEIADLLSTLIEEYPGDDYCLLRRNCCHFADDFCRRLGAGRIPGWIHRLARLGARVDGALQLIGRGLPIMSAGDSSSDEEDL